MTDFTFKVLLVIPVFNHGKTLREVTEKAISTGYPVLVVDDGSDDGGAALLSELDCQVVRLPVNRGKGAAILKGAEVAVSRGFDAIVTIDADGQHNPLEAKTLIEAMVGQPWPAIIIGAREMIQDTVPGSSHFGKVFSNFWVQLECGAELPDTQSGMRIYPVDVLLALNLRRQRYDFEIEAIVKAAWAGVPIRSVSVSVHYPSKKERVSHFHAFLDNWRLTLLHTTLVFRRLLPIPHLRLVSKKQESREKVIVKNPITTLKNLCREKSSPFWLAVAVWFGVFLGALPLLACHTLIIIYVAYRLHFNKVAAVAASQFCMPPVVPVLCIEVGYYLRKGSFILDLSWERWLLEIHYRVLDWFIGSLIVGPLLGLVAAGIVYQMAQRMQKEPLKQQR